MPNLTVDPQTDPLVPNDRVNVNPSPHNFSKSILIGILIFVLLSATAYGAYWYTKNYLVVPSSQPKLSNVQSETSQPKNSFGSLNGQATPAATDETANWKTYSNTQYNISFKHPNLDDLTNSIGIAGPQDTPGNLVKPVVEFADKSTIKMPGTDAAFDGFAIYVVSNTQKYTVSQYVESQKKSLAPMCKEFRGSDYIDQSQQSSLKVGGQQATFLTNTCDHVDRIYVNYPDNKQFIVIGEIQINNSFSGTFDQILSTFKFLP